jgi:hypothetical protein
MSTVNAQTPAVSFLLAHQRKIVGRCFLPWQNRRLFDVSGPEGPAQKIEWVHSASPETIRREPREFDLRRPPYEWRTKSFSARNAHHHKIAASAFCISCAPSVQNTPCNAMRLCRGHRYIAKTSVTTGSLQSSLEALPVPGDLSKIAGRDFLHCTNLMELTAQGFTRTVSITLATKMQSQIPENISD